jgi:hypothetical protein
VIGSGVALGIVRIAAAPRTGLAGVRFAPHLGFVLGKAFGQTPNDAFEPLDELPLLDEFGLQSADASFQAGNHRIASAAAVARGDVHSASLAAGIPCSCARFTYPRESRPNGCPLQWTRTIKQLRHFLRWLNKVPEFAWKRPAELELGQVRIPTTAAEKAATMRSSQVQTYSVDELKILWEHASPLQRLQMLLALNCGFGRAEISSLEAVDVHLHSRHPHEQEHRVVGVG